ncbi:hypothetical protein KCH_41560 [Kitasatospora cheerisanensis KCTC 2395]|uniref:Peptidase C51 domain-containing protein n=1 Tax=Kitasatospora cheerisanensis KCTC 2395 TaxID=1348663 RepID=A0A066Z2G7_9ACTN|nr:CHAP domain-containing protein [Kitasatospora cheerisanensis]KDN84365.1 hypothetical protein KCH_41560 [Kitasatospora cheerisanensis KCTC 2395]
MTVDSMIRSAEAWLGTGEPNTIQSWYRDRNGAEYSGNFAWCDAAITRWSADAGEWQAVCLGEDRPYTPAHAQAFADAGQWTYSTGGIRRGDIVFFDWSMSAPWSGRIGNIDHVGIVTDVLPGGQVATIEGNTADVCARRIRGPEVIVGYGRPAYTRPRNPRPATALRAGTVRPAFPGRLLRSPRRCCTGTTFASGSSGCGTAAGASPSTAGTARRAPRSRSDSRPRRASPRTPSSARTWDAAWNAPITH